MSDKPSVTLSGADDGQSVEPSDAGQSSQSAQSQGEAGAGTEPKYVTAEALSAFEEKISRIVQSQVDKRDARINDRMKTFDQSLEQLKTLGKEIPAEEARALRVKAYEQAVGESSGGETSQAAGQPDPFALESFTGDPYASEMLRLTQSQGVRLHRDDPEAASVVTNQGGYAWAKSYESALKAKQERLASNPTNPTPPEKAPPQGRIPSGGGTAASKALTPEEKLSAGLKNFTRKPG